MLEKTPDGLRLQGCPAFLPRKIIRKTYFDLLYIDKIKMYNEDSVDENA